MASVGGLAVEDVEIPFHRLGQLKWAHSRSVEQPPQFVMTFRVHAPSSMDPSHCIAAPRTLRPRSAKCGAVAV